MSDVTESIAVQAQARLDALAKPQGSLGTLERLAVSLCATQGTIVPRTSPRTLLLFASDHGVVEAGVGIWPQAVTAAMIETIDRGRAVSSALATSTATSLRLIDVGSAAPDRAESPIYSDKRVARGTANLATGAAMTVDQFDAACEVGASEAQAAIAAGARVIALGELGIGNTTPAACLIALLSGPQLTRAASDALVGAGAGATSDSLAVKKQVVAEAVASARDLFSTNPRAAIASIAGYEIAAMAGAIAACADAGVTIILDGVVTAAAALIAEHLAPGCTRSAIAAHRGAEPAHFVALAHLELTAFLDWQMRLGEGTGALLLLPLLDAAAALMTNVATLDEVLSGAKG